MTKHPSRTAYLAACVVITGVFGHAQADPPGQAKAPGYVVATTAAKRVKVTLTVEVKAPKVQADEWSVFAAQVPNLPGQIDVRTTLVPRGKVARELSDEGRPVLFERLPVAGPQSPSRQSLSARLDYEATLLTRQLRRREANDPAGPPVAPLDPKSRRLGLASAHQFDYKTPSFQNWLDERTLRRGPEEDEIDFARRAFAALRKGLRHYEGADVEHRASKVCEAGKSDFGGLTAVYVAVLRGNGIPARSLWGFPVIWEERPNATFFPHARAEFYTAGVGWVPADLAGAIRMNRPGEGLDDFGQDRADFLTTHVDTDLIIDTYFGRKTLEWLPDASWWVIGSGSTDGIQVQHTLSVQVEPLDLDEALAPKPSRPGAARPTAKAPR